MLAQVAQLAKKQGHDAVYQRDFPTAVKRLEQAVRLAPNDADARKQLDEAKRFAAIWPQVEAKAREFDAQIAQLKPFTAYQTMLRIQELQHDMSGGMANPLSQRVSQAVSQAMAEYSAFWQEKTALNSRHFVDQNWEAMLDNAKRTLEREISPDSLNEARSRVTFAESKLAEQRAALDYAAQMKASLEAGRLGDANAAVRELQTRAGLFKPADPRGQPIRDLIAAIQKHQKVAAAKAYAASFFANGNRALAEQDYAGAVPQLAEGLKALRENGDPNDPDLAKYEGLRQDADAKARRIAELMPRIAPVAMDSGLPDKALIDRALGEVTEVLGLQPKNSNAQIYHTRLSDKLKQLAANRARAQQLRQEGAALQTQGKLAEAIAKYRESLTLVPDPALVDHIGKLQAQIAADQQRRQQATQLWNEGTALYTAGRIPEALAKFKESVALLPDAAHQQYIAQVEAALANRARARQLRQEGEALQSANRIREAIGKYRESLVLVPDAALEAHIRVLEQSLIATPTPTPTPGSLPPGTPARIFANGNIGAVNNGPTRATVINLAQAFVVTSLQDYHWNSARGAPPGTIALRDQSGRQYGPWPTVGSPGQGGVPNAYWTARPNTILPAGSYTVIDSDPASWSHNSESGGAGFTQLDGYPAGPNAGYSYTSTPRDGVATPPPNPPVPPATPVPPPCPGAQSSKLLESGNIGGTSNGPTRPTQITLAQSYVITKVQDYHWNSARGARPGTIALRDQSGRTYGPWATVGTPGQGGVPNAYWTATPTVVLPAGTYTVIDSDPASWSHNAESGGRGFTLIEGYAANCNAGYSYTSTPRGATAVPAPSKEPLFNAEYTNRSRQAVHIFVDGKESMGPTNRLTPGERRVVPVANTGIIRFAAGRDGNRLASCRWEGTGVPVVVFEDPANLACMTGVR